MLRTMEMCVVVSLILTVFGPRTIYSAALTTEGADNIPAETRNASSLRFFFPRSSEDAFIGLSRRRQLEKEHYQSNIQKTILATLALNKPTNPTMPPSDKLLHITAYPSCVGPSDQAQWFPNGHRRLQFYFPTIPLSVRSATIPFSHQANLYLRTKNPADSNRRASTPSSGGSTPNDVDANLDASYNVIQVNIVSPGLPFQQSHIVDLSNSYPYVKIPVLFFVASWMATHDKEPQRLEVAVSDPVTNETLNVGDYFVGMRCASAEPKLSLPSRMEHVSHEYLERLEDSFLDVVYSITDAYTTTALIRNTGINLRNLSRLPRSHRANNGNSKHHHKNDHNNNRNNNINSIGSTAPSKSELRCEKRREYLPFSAAGSPSIFAPAGFSFVTCECSRTCDNGSEKPCLPCQTRTLKTTTVRVYEKENNQLIMRERRLPSDCDCF